MKPQKQIHTAAPPVPITPIVLPKRRWFEVIPEYANYCFLLLFSMKFLMFWIQPQSEDASKILSLAVLLGFEFFMVPSGVLIMLPRKILLFIFFPFYLAFALVFNSMVYDHSIIILYFATVLNRMRFVFSHPTEEQVHYTFKVICFATIIYFILLMGTGFGADYIPHLGLTNDFINANIIPIVKVGGSLTERPYTAMCMGFLYFFLVTLMQFILFEQGRKYKVIKFAAVLLFSVMLFLGIAYYTNRPF